MYPSLQIGIAAIMLIGILAGYFAFKIFHGRGKGLAKNMVVGILGSVIGGWICSWIGYDVAGYGGLLLSATLGAIVLLCIASLIKW